MGVENEFLTPFAHLFAFPALHTLFLNRKAFIGNNQVLVDPDYFPEAFALGTSAHRAVEVEHQFRRLFERDPV
ncbi:hypothetical protein SDC9_113147 [bioreactor metagenome]|uniref:Uncharacterized protein n=1 Tax=bioreactor metagenome TaxID=1076179 RepID=A0A645BL96_9ZZZZ